MYRLGVSSVSPAMLYSKLVSSKGAGMGSAVVVMSFRNGPTFCTCTCSSRLYFNWFSTCNSNTVKRNVRGLSVQIPNINISHNNSSVYSLRNFSSQPETSEGERQLRETIEKCFPNATNVVVEDISGGCGSMYSIFIEAPDFQGLSTVKQHLLVNKALKQEIKSMHGIRIQTAVPKSR